MAVVTRKSTYITARDTVNSNPVASAIHGGRTKTAEGYVTTASGDSAGSVFPLVSIPSNSRVRKIEFQCEAQGAGCTMDVGAFAPTVSPTSLVALGYANGAAISATFFANAINAASAVGVTDVTNQSGTNTIDKQELELWAALGLASDPACSIDLGVNVHVATAAAGRVGIKVDYVD